MAEAGWAAVVMKAGWAAAGWAAAGWAAGEGSKGRRTSQPCASKRIDTSSDWVCSAILSRVTPFESYIRMRLSSFSWPAKATASLATPSCRQPSPHSTTTWWSMMVWSAVLRVAAACLAAAAMPTPLPMPWPSGPVVDSMPGVCGCMPCHSGWPGVLESLTRKFETSSLGRS